MKMTEYKMTVGIEVHVELKAESKIFCSCKTDFGAEPNTHICPVCMGLPGALPVLNRRAVELAVKAGLATNCKISSLSRIDRKNYFYPDLPKGYQISQYDRPLCYGGYIDINAGGSKKRIGITRIHIEEDAGKLIHGTDGTLIDHNRCGVPLIEIVSEPHIHSSEEARAYLKKLRTLLIAVGVSDCKMNEGSMRCDVNLSVAPTDSDKLGERTEIKNLNSFSFAAKAIEYEFSRQREMLLRGDKIIRQTLRYNTESGKCEVMRSKESAVDYHFMSEPDLHAIKISEGDVERIRQEMPPLPDQRKQAYMDELELGDYDSSLLSSDPALSSYFEAASNNSQYVKTIANLLISEILRLCEGEDFYCPIPPQSLRELSMLFAEEKINSSTAKKMIARMWSEPELSPTDLAESEKLWQINDREILEPMVTEAIKTNPKAVADYKGGKSFAIRSIIGKAMGLSGGKANPRIVEELIFEKIEPDSK